MVVIIFSSYCCTLHPTLVQTLGSLDRFAFPRPPGQAGTHLIRVLGFLQSLFADGHILDVRRMGLTAPQPSFGFGPHCMIRTAKHRVDGSVCLISIVY